MVVQHNLTAMNSNRQLGVTTSGQAKSSEKLSSGYRINRAGDDAAGLKISEKMRSQIRGLNKASTNAQDGVSLIQTAEGALNEAHSILQRMNELAVQGANDTNQDIDRDAINEELDALTSELDRISQTTQFNKQNLLDGTFTEKRLQVGANTNQNITISINAMNAAAIGLSRTIVSGIQGKLTVAGNEEKVAATSGAARTCAGCIAAKNVVLTSTGAQNAGQLYITGAENSFAVGDSADLRASYAQMVSKTATIEFQNSKESFTGANVDNYEKANATISVVQKAINNVSSQRSALGALQNRLEHTIANLDNVSENTQSAESRIRDTDMASEMVEYSKNNILAQAGQAMLAQANQSTQGVLSLLQ
jgi:flagellin